MIKKFFRYCIFTSIGILIHLFKKKVKKISKSKIIILGRGRTLKYYYENYTKFKNIKDIVLVNFSSEDIGNYFYTLKGKRVHIVMNIVEEVISIFQIMFLNFGKVFIARFKKNDVANKNYGLVRKDSKANLYGQVNFFCDRNIIPFDNKKMGAGFLTIVYFVLKFKIKNVYLFGFDFYQEGLKFNFYNRNDFKNKKQALQHSISGKKNIKLFHKFIKTNKKTTFFYPEKNSVYKKISNFKLLSL